VLVLERGARSDGVMECWSDGVMECWSVGVLECWSVGVLETLVGFVPEGRYEGGLARSAWGNAKTAPVP
jgi:hypothetical protein